MWLETEWRVSYETCAHYGAQWKKQAAGPFQSRESMDQFMAMERLFLGQIGFIRNVRVESRIVGPWVAPMEVKSER